MVESSKRAVSKVRSRRCWVVICGLVLTGLAGAAVVPTTIEDFHLPGTQVGDVPASAIKTSVYCAECHGLFERKTEPYTTWTGSLMGQAGRDPLFYAQMTTANQDVDKVGYFCMRCHVPMSFVTGHAYDTDGSTLDDFDREGVACHFCHSMADPIYDSRFSPDEDKRVLGGLAEVPEHYGNAMFVLDPTGLRRGPRDDTESFHSVVPSKFFRSGNFCGTCHDVGNVTLNRLPDGTYKFNEIDQPTDDTDPQHLFPLERTYTEWKLSEFAEHGVDMNGRFGGDGVSVVACCQDCHMPRAAGQASYYSSSRSDLAVHDFAGASAWVLDIIAEYYKDDDSVDKAALRAGRNKALDMLERAATLELRQEGGTLVTRVINESGHKLPTGHIEGRRVWVNVRLFGSDGGLLREYGHYDADEAELDEESTDVYEMHVGLSEAMSEATGYPPGITTHMALADVIVKDNRIPPRGFNNAKYEEAGAPAVGCTYADGQYWDDTPYWIPPDAVRAEVRVYYQTVTRHYIEALRDGNHTDHWGETLHDLWLTTDKGPPILMTQGTIEFAGFMRGDADGDGDLDRLDRRAMDACLGASGRELPAPCGWMDFDGDNGVDRDDRAALRRAMRRP
ncbi:MAG: hypothetical protein IT449_08835 [Phycisphaerales bacterium]|nr:hypothetical protein [Phycisphaerales bacterium]